MPIYLTKDATLLTGIAAVAFALIIKTEAANDNNPQTKAAGRG